MSKTRRELKVYEVRIVKVWAFTTLAETAKEAKDNVWERALIDGFDAEDSNKASASVLRDPSTDEIREYYNTHEEDNEPGEDWYAEEE